jgi:large subunit ribosomal protein L10
MGRTLENKQQIVEDLKGLFTDAQVALVIDYAGLTVAEITNLRNRLEETGAVCKVTKNTLMRRAIEENEDWSALTGLLKGTNAFLLVKDDIGGAIKAYQAFAKETKKTELRGGVMEGRALSVAEIKAIGDLPSKEVLLAQIAGSIQQVTAKIARGINEVPASIARGVKAVSEKEAA